MEIHTSLRWWSVPVRHEIHDEVIKWKHFPRYWPFVRGIHRSHKGQWREALMFSLICTRINGWINNREAGDLRRHHAHYDVTVMWFVNTVAGETFALNLLTQLPSGIMNILHSKFEICGWINKTIFKKWTHVCSYENRDSFRGADI